MKWYCCRTESATGPLEHTQFYGSLDAIEWIRVDRELYYGDLGEFKQIMTGEILEPPEPPRRWTMFDLVTTSTMVTIMMLGADDALL